MPSPSTPTVTGDVWSPSPDRRVTSTAQWLRATNARASSGLTRPPWWSARLARLNPRSRLFGGHLDPQQPEGHLDGRTDPEGEQDGTDAGREVAFRLLGVEVPSKKTAPRVQPC